MLAYSLAHRTRQSTVENATSITSNPLIIGVAGRLHGLAAGVSRCGCWRVSRCCSRRVAAIPVSPAVETMSIAPAAPVARSGSHPTSSARATRPNRAISPVSAGRPRAAARRPAAACAAARAIGRTTVRPGPAATAQPRRLRSSVRVCAAPAWVPPASRAPRAHPAPAAARASAPAVPRARRITRAASASSSSRTPCRTATRTARASAAAAIPIPAAAD
jgi:hypothetical protein